MRFCNLFFILLFLTSSVVAQDKLTREEKKAKKKEKQLAAKEEALKYINDKTFVVEASMVYDKQMNPYNLSPVTNFVMVDGETLTLQMAFSGLMGWNGIGGITMEGKITKYEVHENKEAKPIDIKMYAQGSAMGNVTLFFTVDSAQTARITYTDALGTRLTFSGNFFSLEESAVFKSRQTY